MYGVGTGHLTVKENGEELDGRPLSKSPAVVLWSFLFAMSTNRVKWDKKLAPMIA